MKRYFFRRHNAGVTTSIEADHIFWSGSSIVFLREGNTIAAICLMAGDVVILEGAWRDLDADTLEKAAKQAEAKPTKEELQDMGVLPMPENKSVN